MPGRASSGPGGLGAWEEQVRRTEAIAGTAVRPAELDDVPAANLPDPDGLSRRTTELVADLVEPAKPEAHQKLGEGVRALAVATGWVRTRLAPRSVADVESVAQE